MAVTLYALFDGRVFMTTCTQEGMVSGETKHSASAGATLMFSHVTAVVHVVANGQGDLICDVFV